jgi:hypothetical protein
MDDSQNANRGKPRKRFDQINLQNVEKSIRSINRTFHGLQNGLFSLFICGQKSGAKSLLWKAVLWEWAISDHSNVDRISFHSYLLGELSSHGFVENCRGYVSKPIQVYQPKLERNIYKVLRLILHNQSDRLCVSCFHNINPETIK